MQMQRTILWVVFSMSILLLWDAWQQHTGNPSLLSPAPQSVADNQPGNSQAAGGAVPGSSTSADANAGIPSVGASGAAGANGAAVPTPSGVTAPVSPSAQSAAGTAQTYQLQNDVLSLQIDGKGSVVSRALLKEHRELQGEKENVVLFNAQPGNFYVAQTGLINAPAGSQFPTHHTAFVPTGEGVDSRLTMVAESGGLRIEREYSLIPNSYVIGIKETVQNTSDAVLNPVVYRQLTRDNHSPPGDTFFYQTFAGPVIYTDEQKFQKIDYEDIIDGSAEHASSAKDGWIGLIQHYFASAWIPQPGLQREYYTQKAGADLVSVGYKQALEPLAPGASLTTEVQLYVGPQDQNVLEKLAPGLDLTVDYGFLTVIAKPIYWLLNWLHSHVGNWGWAIVLLTLIIKTLFFPLQAASYRSMARMKAVAPRLTALRERYGDDRAKLNQAMMELYKTEKINPLGGCLPILVQIPVFISLYWVLQASVEMRDAPWIGWITDLASPDPLYILPLLMAISMFVQVKLNPKPPDPMQAKVMMFMPIAFSVMFFFFPAGLVLYWLVNNLYSIAQQWFITKKILGDKKG